MKALRVFVFDIVAPGVIIGWILWKYPEALDRVIPWLALGVLWHLTLEVAEAQFLKRKNEAVYARWGKRPMTWFIVFCIGGLISLGYWYSIRFGIDQLAVIALKGKSPTGVQPENSPKTPDEKSAQKEQLPQQPKPPFHIIAGPAMRTPKRESFGELIAAFNKQGRYTVIPLNLSIYLRITNLQPVRCIIEKYNVEIKTENGEWVKLIRIDGRAYDLFVVTPPNLSNADLVKADPLDAALDRKQLDVRENVEGWAFFEYPSKFANAQFSQTYRVTISDNAGVTFRSPELTPVNDPSNEGVQGAILRTTGKKADLSGAIFTHIKNQ